MAVSKVSSSHLPMSCRSAAHSSTSRVDLRVLLGHCAAHPGHRDRVLDQAARCARGGTTASRGTARTARRTRRRRRPRAAPCAAADRARTPASALNSATSSSREREPAAMKSSGVDRLLGAQRLDRDALLATEARHGSANAHDAADRNRRGLRIAVGSRPQAAARCDRPAPATGTRRRCALPASPLRAARTGRRPSCRPPAR